MFSELIQNMRINRVRMVKMTQLRRLVNRRCSEHTRRGDRLTYQRIHGPEDVVNSSPPDVQRRDHLVCRIRTPRLDKKKKKTIVIRVYCS